MIFELLYSRLRRAENGRGNQGDEPLSFNASSNPTTGLLHGTGKIKEQIGCLE